MPTCEPYFSGVLISNRFAIADNKLTDLKFAGTFIVINHIIYVFVDSKLFSYLLPFSHNMDVNLNVTSENAFFR